MFTAAPLLLFLHLIIFIFLSCSIFYTLGFISLWTVKDDLKEYEIITISLVSGIIIFVALAIFLGLLKLRFLSLPIITILLILSLLKYRARLFHPWKTILKIKMLMFIMLLGIITQGVINFPSGYIYNKNMLFWSAQGHDGLWHVSLMQEVIKNLPPNNPAFSGEKLYNYHYLIDVLMGEYNRIFPFFYSLDLYFRFFPILISFLIGMSVFSLIVRWKHDKTIGYLGLFFTYFVGSFGYIVTIIRDGKIFAGETAFWSSQQNTILGNPPQAAAHFILVTLFLTLLLYIKLRRRTWLLFTFLLGFLLAGFKVSGGFVMLTGILAAGIIDLFISKSFLLLFTGAALVLSNFLTFKLMTSAEAASFLVFLPWWFIRSMVVDRLGLLDWEYKREHYISKGTWHAWLRVAQLEITSLLIFIIGNMGMRAIGFLYVGKQFFQKIYKSPFEVGVLVSGLTGLIVPIFFVQKGVIYNNIQFLQYFLLIFGFYGAICFYELTKLFKNIKIKLALFLVLAIFSLPTVLGSLNEFYGPNSTPLAKISDVNIKALDFIVKNTRSEDVILTIPFNANPVDLNSWEKYSAHPEPIYLWYSTSYITALTGRSTYLTSEEQALITGYPVKERLEKEKNFFSQKDFAFNREFLKENKIKYIYIEKLLLEKDLSPDRNGIEKIYENDEVVIYKTILE